MYLTKSIYKYVFTYYFYDNFIFKLKIVDTCETMFQLIVK